MRAKCRKCGDTVEVTKLREFRYCKCGAIALDYGDGENYYRAVGNPEDFDGEIEDVPKMKERTAGKINPGASNRISGTLYGVEGTVAQRTVAEQIDDHMMAIYHLMKQVYPKAKGYAATAESVGDKNGDEHIKTNFMLVPDEKGEVK